MAEPEEAVLFERRQRVGRFLTYERKRIGTHIGFDLCPSPVWDILLDLYLARRTAPAIQIWSLCVASNIPTSTAHRRISEMIDGGILVRSTAGGRVMVSLSGDYVDKLDRLLDDVAGLFPTPQPCECNSTR